MRLLKSFGRFWYDFIIGDDWKVAAAVVVALAVVVAVMRLDLMSGAALAVLGGVVIVLAFTISLIVDLRSKSKD